MKAEKINKEIIVNYIKNNHLSKTKFCELCGITRPTFYRLLANKENISTQSILRITRTMNIKFADILYKKEKSEA